MKVCRCVDSLRFPDSLLGAGNRSESGRENTYDYVVYLQQLYFPIKVIIGK